MKKYKHIPTIITIVLLVAVMTVSVIAWAAWRTPDGEVATALDSQPSPEDAQAVRQTALLSLNDYALDVDASKTNVASFATMLSCADDILSNYDTIQLQNHPAIATYLSYSANKLDNVSIEDDVVTIRNADCATAQSYANVENKIKYLMLLSFITSEYADSIRVIELDVDMYRNFDPLPSILMCPDYKALGYETPDAYWAAYDRGEHFIEGTPYCVSLEEPYIAQLYTPSAENLFDAAAEDEAIYDCY